MNFQRFTDRVIIFVVMVLVFLGVFGLLEYHDAILGFAHTQFVGIEAKLQDGLGGYARSEPTMVMPSPTTDEVKQTPIVIPSPSPTIQPTVVPTPAVATPTVLPTPDGTLLNGSIKLVGGDPSCGNNSGGKYCLFNVANVKQSGTWKVTAAAGIDVWGQDQKSVLGTKLTIQQYTSVTFYAEGLNCNSNVGRPIISFYNVSTGLLSFVVIWTGC